MSEAEPGNDPLAIAQGLTDSLTAMTAELGKLRSAVRWGKRIIIALAISFAVDIVVTAGLGWNTIRQDETQNSSHADLIAACQQANVNRKQDAAVWDTFLSDIAPPDAQTPHVRALLAGIDARIKTKDELRNCTAQYRTR